MTQKEKTEKINISCMYVGKITKIYFIIEDIYFIYFH